MTIKCIAKELTDMGYSLVAWDSESGKNPNFSGWGMIALDPIKMNGEDMIGLNHGLSGTVVLDGDDLERTRSVFGTFLGLDTEAMPGGPPTYHGNPVNRRKWVYRLPEGVVIPGVKKLTIPGEKGHETIFEIRACEPGKQAQDVLPPSPHPEGHQYTWLKPMVPIDELPILPAPIMDLVTNWNDMVPLMRHQLTGHGITEITRGKASDEAIATINDYCRTHDLAELLSLAGYEHCYGNRWLRPGSGTGSPGVTTWPADQTCDKERAFFFDGSPTELTDGKPHDAWDIKKHLLQDVATKLDERQEAVVRAVLGRVSEDTVGLAFTEAHGGRLRYLHGAGKWYVWTGNRWVQDGLKRTLHAVRNLTRTHTTKPSQAKSSFYEGVLKVASSDPTIAGEFAEYDQDNYLLATPGGLWIFATAVSERRRQLTRSQRSPARRLR